MFVSMFIFDLHNYYIKINHVLVIIHKHKIEKMQRNT